MSSSRNSENDLNHYSSLEQDEEDRITFKTSDQLKFETLILRFGKVCLLCSSLLFVGQIVSAAVRRHPGAKIFVFLSSRSVKLREFSFLSLYIF